MTHRILIYSHDTFGLGNIRRMVAIAESLVAADDAVTALIATGSPMLQAFRLSERIDYVKLPCLRRDTHGRYSVRSLQNSWEQVIALRARLLLDIADHFRPHTLIVDKKPFGVGEELKPALQQLRKQEPLPRTFLLLRDILDAPTKTQAIWHKNNYHSAIEHYYDKVLVVGQRELFDIASEYNFPQTSRKKILYCGYLNKEPDNDSNADTTQTLVDVVAARNTSPEVLVTAGGGEDGQALVALCIAAAKAHTTTRPFHTRIVLGPEMAQTDRLSFHAQAEPDLEVLDFVDNLPKQMNDAALVVSMAGYNTVCELLALHKNAILVPREHPVCEQLIRARRMAAMGLFDYVRLDKLTPASLLQRIVRQLEHQHTQTASTTPPCFAQIDLNGFATLNEVVLGNQVNMPRRPNRASLDTMVESI